MLAEINTKAGRYGAFATYYLEKVYPDKSFDVLGFGLTSETLLGLSEDGHAGGRFARPCLSGRHGRVLEMAKPEVVVATTGLATASSSHSTRTASPPSGRDDEAARPVQVRG